MIEVIPSINAVTFEEVKEKIKQVEPFTKWAHLDVSDGAFTGGYVSWCNPEDLLNFETPLFLEVHLMISDMDVRWRDWVLPRVNRVIFHLEAAHDPELVIGKIHENGKEAGVAIAPETSWERVEPYCISADLIQTLAVSPGASGQRFDVRIPDKIRALRARYEKCIIEADGGVDLETGKTCIEAGASILVSGKYIFESDNIKQAIEDLRNGPSTR